MRVKAVGNAGIFSSVLIETLWTTRREHLRKSLPVIRQNLKTTEYLNTSRIEIKLSGCFYAHLQTGPPAWKGKPKKNRGERNMKTEVRKVNETLSSIVVMLIPFTSSA